MTTNQYFNSLLKTTNNGADWAEPYSLGLSAPTRFRFAIATGVSTADPTLTTDFSAHGLGTTSHSGTGIHSTAYYWAGFVNSGEDSTRQQIQNEFGGPTVPNFAYDSAATLHKRMQITSYQNGYIWVESYAGYQTFNSSAAYIYFHMSGSVDTLTDETRVCVQDSGVTYSSGGFFVDSIVGRTGNSFQADYVLLFMPSQGNAATDGAADTIFSPSMHFIDLRAGRQENLKWRGMNNYYWNTVVNSLSIPDQLGTAVRTNGICGFVSGSDAGIDAGWRIVSQDANTDVIWEVAGVSSQGTTTRSYQGGYTLFRFYDTNVHFKVGHHFLVGTTAVQTIQCNSIQPEAMFAFCNGEHQFSASPGGTSVGSWKAPRENFDFLAYGFWAVDAGTPTCFSHMHQWNLDAHSGQTNITWNRLINVPDVSNGASGTSSVFLGVDSLSVTSNEVIYMLDTCSDTAVNSMILCYTIFGHGIDAPAHLQGPDGTSLLLHDNEYGDDLLLSSATGGGGGGPPDPGDPPAGTAVKRVFPVSFDKRDYPVPENIIRDFPLE